jgi:hypothetical protein
MNRAMPVMITAHTALRPGDADWSPAEAGPAPPSAMRSNVVLMAIPFLFGCVLRRCSSWLLSV